MKKFIVSTLLMAFIALPASATINKATLINKQGQKVVVNVGSQNAQHYFGLGYGLMGSSPELGLSFINWASDVIGAKTGTSTVGVNFNVGAAGGQSATSTYVTKVNSTWDSAVLTFKALKASSTANMLFAFEASNDDYCDTATTTTIYDVVTTDQINWFKIDSNFSNKVHSTSMTNASTTLLWDNPQAGATNTVILDNLNYNCLRISASGSSTVMWTQIRGKKK